MPPLVVDASWVLAADGDQLRLLPDHAVVVDGDLIADVRPSGSVGGARRIDARGQLLLAGLISAHTHVAAGTPTRGLIEEGRSYARPLELVEELDDDALDALTLHNLAEIVRAGCTTQVEMSLSLRQAESYVRAARALGVRGYPAPMVPGIARLFPIWFRQSDAALHDSVPGTLEEIGAALEFGRRWNGAEQGRIRPQIALHATDTHTPETLGAAVAAARELGNGIHVHLAQLPFEPEATARLWGQRPVEWLAAEGVLDEPVIGAHMNDVDLVADPPILVAHGTTYAHCPSANGAGGMSQPFPELLAAGVNCAIGIDTHSTDLVENVKNACLQGRVRDTLLAPTRQVPSVRPSPLDVVRCATLNAADGLRRPDLGRIAVGAKADLVALDVSGALVGSGASPPEPLNHLLYAHGLAVRHVLVDGHALVSDGRLVAADEDRIRQRGGEVVRELWERLRAEGALEQTAG